MMSRRLRKFARLLLRPREQAPKVTGPTYCGSVTFLPSVCREDIRDDCLYDQAWPVADE